MPDLGMRKRWFGMNPGDLECPGAILLPDGRAIGITAWTPTCQVDTHVTVHIEGILYSAESASAKRLRAFRQDEGQSHA